jgi:hypothetical protein
MEFPTNIRTLKYFKKGGNMKSIFKTGLGIIFCLLPALFIIACGGGGGDTAPGIAPGQTVTLAAVTLSGNQEVPAVVTQGSGSATVTVSADRSQIAFSVTFTGLTSATTLAHIHIGPPGVSGPVIVNFALAAFTSPLTGTATAADFVPQPALGINTFADAVNAVLAGNTYINVHTVNNPTGEIRGALGPARLTATLTGDQEVPPVVTAGTGTANIIFNNLQTAISFNVAFSGLTSATTLSHIHVGPAGVSGPPIVNFALAAFTSPLIGTATVADFVPQPAQGINTFNDAIRAILSGNSYVNVHTVTNPPGEIRGQFIGVTAPGTTAPAVDIFSSIGNTTLSVAAPGLLANDPAGTQILNPGPRATTALGTVTVNADGSFVYTPATGAQNVTDTFTYTATGNVSVPVRINLIERAWYVRNNFAGTSTGSNTAPFSNLGSAIAAADANDTLFVFAGDGTTAGGQDIGLSLLAGQKLIGEGAGLTIGGRVIIPAGATPVISNTGVVGIPVVTLANNNEIAGIQFNAGINEAIFGSGITGFNIHNNVIPAPAREGIRILSPTGTGLIANNTITGDPAGREGILIANTEDAGGNPIAPVPVVATITVTGNTISDITSAGRQGIRVIFDGAGTSVKIAVNGNDISNSSAEAIRIDSGAAGAAVNADIIGNILANNGGIADVLVQANGTSTRCVELINNGNALNNATFQMANNTGAAANFLFFETGNDTVAARNPAPGQFTSVLEGACGVP